MRLMLVAVVVCGVLAVASGCTDDQRGAPAPRSSTPTRIARRPDGSELAERLGCTSTRSGGVHVPGSTEPATDCYVDGRFVARLEMVQRSRRSEALKRLSARDVPDQRVPCPGRSVVPAPWIVVGSEWLAVTESEADARFVIAEVGGFLAPDSGSIGPIASYLLPCSSG